MNPLFHPKNRFTPPLTREQFDIAVHSFASALVGTHDPINLNIATIRGDNLGVLIFTGRGAQKALFQLARQLRLPIGDDDDDNDHPGLVPSRN